MVEYAWSWADYERLIREKPTARVQPRRQTKRSGGAVARFVGGGTNMAMSRDSVALREDHPALAESRTLFVRSRQNPTMAAPVLKSGVHDAKTGARITKGAWQGAEIFTLTLEERATCPPCCDLWRECYGNAMPYARRQAHGDVLELRLAHDLVTLCKQHGRIAVRLHVLGDFYSEHYVKLWRQALSDLPGLYVWGYTHHPGNSHLGRLLGAMNQAFPDRCAIRFSVRPDVAPAPMTATTIWRKPEASVVPEGQVCPQQTEATLACGSCGLCWAPDMIDKPIVFTGYGMTGGRRKAVGQGELV